MAGELLVVFTVCAVGPIPTGICTAWVHSYITVGSSPGGFTMTLVAVSHICTVAMDTWIAKALIDVH